MNGVKKSNFTSLPHYNLISRNFCQKIVRTKFRNFCTYTEQPSQKIGVSKSRLLLFFLEFCPNESMKTQFMKSIFRTHLIIFHQNCASLQYILPDNFVHKSNGKKSIFCSRVSLLSFSRILVRH